MAIEILNPGLLTSVQDEGRFGMQRYGMSPAGAMDVHSMKLANILAGNDMQTGTLECTFMGPSIKFEESEVIAITGADLSPAVDGQPVPMWTAFCVPAGSTLTTGGCRNGSRSYIAFAGGLDIPVLDGSQSTFLRSKIGGFEGRKLKAGDRIGLRAPQAVLKNMALRRLPAPQKFDKSVTVRVIPGPQDDRFTEAGLNTLYGSEYKISEKSDRMGFKTEGPEIEHVNNDANILSDGIPYGAVQVPLDGKPMIMMSEHAGSGGYTKVGTIISVDMPLVAQLAPGGVVRFSPIDVDTAQDLYVERLNEYERLKELFSADYEAVYHLVIDGVDMISSVQRVE